MSVRPWLPSRRDLFIQGLLLAVVPVWNFVQTMVQGYPIWLVLVTTAGITVIVLVGYALVLALRGPRNVSNLSDDELMDRIDVWIGKAGYGRVNQQWPGHSHARRVTSFDNHTSMFIGKPDGRPMIVVVAERTWVNRDGAAVTSMTPSEWSDMQHDLALELVRFGVFYRHLPNPLTITYWLSIPKEAINQTTIVQTIEKIHRADLLIVLLSRRYEQRALLGQPLQAGVAGSPPQLA